VAILGSTGSICSQALEVIASQPSLSVCALAAGDNWRLLLEQAGKFRPDALAVLEGFDAESLRFTLRQACAMKVGDRFSVYAPAANWSIHHNTLVGCQAPILLDCYGSATSLVRENLLTRGAAVGVQKPIDVRGEFKLIDNQLSGFEEPGAAPDRPNPKSPRGGPSRIKP